jgi:hypothetical protein
MELSSMLVGEMRYYQISLALALSVQLPNLNLLDIGSSKNISNTSLLMSPKSQVNIL